MRGVGPARVSVAGKHDSETEGRLGARRLTCWVTLRKSLQLYSPHRCPSRKRDLLWLGSSVG